jgi:hypothetical protein
VAAFQVQPEGACCMKYLIYSLSGTPHLLRTIEGGFFNASDIDLDGRIEIWAVDTAAFNNLDDILLDAMTSPPMLALRLEKGRLLDATAEFTEQFDATIARIRAEIDAESMRAFKQSDGRLVWSVKTFEKLTPLRKVKTRLLEIVLAYLYSGRERQAWQFLREVWPENDVERIRSTIMDARKRGISAQVDGPAVPVATKKKAQIFQYPAVKEPQGMQLWRLKPQNLSDPRLSGKVLLDLVVDSAGKVYSVETQARDPELLQAVKEWKFIPAMRNGHSVACRFRINFSLKL